MDPNTANIALSIAQLCTSITMVGVYFAAPVERYTRLWAMSGVLTALGMALILPNAFRPPGVMLVLGNVALFAGCVVVWVGLESFFEQKATRKGYLLIFLFSCFYFLLIAEGATLIVRACFSSSSLILVFSLCLKTLLRRTHGICFSPSGFARNMAIIGLAMLIVAHLLRLILLLYTPMPFSLVMMSQVHTVVVYLIPLVGTLLFFPSLLLLYFERIKHQLLLLLESKQEALETQTRFVDMFSHEYRTPLAVIRTNLDILHHKDNSQGNIYGSNLGKMRRAVLRLVEVAETALMRDMNADNKNDIHYEPIALNDFIYHVIDEASDFWSDRAPQFTFEYTNTCAVYGERKLLKTAILNLFDNAIKYGPKNGTIMVFLIKNDDTVTLTISDNGPGIPQLELDLVYGKYFRGSRTGFVAGSGIGLYLVQRIISQHGGYIQLSNRPEGGTSATVSLPCYHEEVQNNGI
ncbi:sensor histidine kinase [Candidatus Symbiopectobacterium sp. NZEC135]|uniref:sensor histidine kinase n=1 Tax=Candidatus Symbiopectobacterium sp. NZEC135 TaxID=2820471 RepID=UPI00222667CC|nr:HAMP domain-containing sensor histidine kinase [Candidatus Symbiopectobacterium sp. NZEC135]